MSQSGSSLSDLLLSSNTQPSTELQETRYLATLFLLWIYLIYVVPYMKNGYFAIFLILALLLSNHLPALAQDDENLDEAFSVLVELLNKEIYTGSGILEKVKDIPASVVIIDREEIEIFGYTTLLEILENIPGLSLTDEYLDQTIGVRGFWSTYYNRNVVILINGIRTISDRTSTYSPSGLIVPVESIDRVEVIRGPMSVIYGSGAFFGVINVVTNETSKGTSVMSVSTGSNNSHSVAVHLTGQESKDLSFAATGHLFTTDGLDVPFAEISSRDLSFYGVKPGSSTAGLLENNGAYFDATITKGDFTIKSMFREWNPEIMSVAPSPSDSDGSAWKRQDFRTYFDFKKDYSENFKVHGYFGYIRTDTEFDLKYFSKDNYTYQDVSSSTMEGEFQTTYIRNSKLSLIAGISHRRSNDITTRVDAPVGGLTNHLGKNLDPIIENALFSQINYLPKPWLKLTAGIRFQNVPEYRFVQYSNKGLPNQSVFSSSYHLDKIFTVPRLGAIISIDENNSLKLLYGQGINYPGDFLSATAQLEDKEARLNLLPEAITTFEINYIWTPTDNTMLSASIFRNSLSDLISRDYQFVPPAGWKTKTANAGQLKTKGFEITVNYKTRKLRFELAGTFQDTENLTTSKVGVEFGRTPMFLGYFKAAYQLMDNTSLSTTATYVGPMKAVWDPTMPNNDGAFGARLGDDIDGYLKLGLNARVKNIFGSRFFLNLRIMNALNAEIRYPTLNNSWVDKGYLGHSRQWRLSLGRSF
jgi:outer membrane receptor for ferrienterochelin and colicins